MSLANVFAAALAALALGTAPAQAADAYPSKPLKIIVGFAPAGSADLMARLLADKLGERLGQPVVVENRPGAAGTIGATAVARASPDGYTLLIASLSNGVIAPLMMKVPPYEPTKDFAPVTIAALTPLVLVVNASLPVNNVRELIALAKSKPEEVSFLSGGMGTATGMAGELFVSMAGLKVQHVPYNGDGPGVAALLGGTGTFMIPSLVAALPHIKSGKLKALAMGTSKRIASMPDVPTIAESGVPGYEVDVWNGVLAPAQTSPEVVGRLNQEIVRILKEPEVAAKVAAMGYELVGSTPQEFANSIRSGEAKWPEIIKRSGAKIE